MCFITEWLNFFVRKPTKEDCAETMDLVRVRGQVIICATCSYFQLLIDLFLFNVVFKILFMSHHDYGKVIR